MNKYALIIGGLLLVGPLFIPKYPEYPRMSKSYEWGQIETWTNSYIENKNDNTGVFRTRVYLYPNSVKDKKCSLDLLFSEAKSQSGIIVDDRMAVMEPYLMKKGMPILIPFFASGEAPMENIDIIVRIKSGEHCGVPNSVIEVKETLILKMRHHTAWNFLFNLLMSV